MLGFHAPDRLVEVAALAVDVPLRQGRLEGPQLLDQRRAGPLVDRVPHGRSPVVQTFDGTSDERIVIGHGGWDVLENP